jgi:predicted glycosyltransferase
MRIWIDFINTPQVSFFIPFIKEFRKYNHEILLTCRDSGNTVELLRQNELVFHIVGKKVGKGIIQKLLFFMRRLFNLYFFIRKHNPDIAASQSSFYQPIVAKIFNIPCLYTNDNEHAKGNLFGFLFATKVVLPVVLQNEEFTKRWPLKSKLFFYPSVKEAIYLSQLPDLLTIASGTKNKIYFRPEPWSAQYYNGPLNFFDDTLIKLSLEFDVIILPRDKNQTEHFTQDKFNTLTVALESINLHKIVSNCLLFIGAGGSMTRELAVMEMPVISIYKAKMLSVDKYLINKGLMKANPYITYEDIIAFLCSKSRPEKELAILNEGKESFLLIKNLIMDLNNEKT